MSVSESFDLNVVPYAQVCRLEVDGCELWRAFGTDPAFQCLPEQGWPLPGGWYEVEAEVRVVRGAVHAPCFYPAFSSDGGGEADRIHLPLGHARRGTHRLRTLVLFHSDLVGLRFDPSVLPCEFVLTRLTLRRLNRLGAAKMMIRELMVRRGATGRLALLGRMGMDMLLGGPRRMADGLYADYAAQPGMELRSDYAIWMEFYDDTSPETLVFEAERVSKLELTPTVSVILPVYNTAEKWLRACVASVQAQVYPHWELCIANDASTMPHVRPLLEELAGADARIKVVHRSSNGHISRASNSALGIATGEYVALLDHDDALHPLALLDCVEAFTAHPRWRMLFTDEDKIDEEGVRSDPYFKSDWNPDLFLGQNCVCHLSVYRRDLIEEVQGFRAGYEGAQDWDLTLRAVERLEHEEIGHVPRILYHWRMIKGSTALAAGEKSYAHTAALRVLQSHLDREAQGARVEELEGYSGYYRIVRQVPKPLPLVSLLIPTRDGVVLLRQCIDSILEKTDYGNYEIVVLDNGSREAATLAYFAQLEAHPKVRVVPFDFPFNYSAINNFGAGVAKGELLGLINNDIEVISPGWLREMVSHAIRPDIGVVGAMLYYPNNTIQHAGVILGIGGVAGHCYSGSWRGYGGDKFRAGLVQNLSAVTAACMVMRATVFAEVGGLDERLTVAFNDIDFCIRVRDAGYRNLWTPFAELYHHESATRGYETTPQKVARFKGEESFMKARWRDALLHDPYYNPNLAIDMAPFSLAFPPRPWRGRRWEGAHLGTSSSGVRVDGVV